MRKETQIEVLPFIYGHPKIDGGFLAVTLNILDNPEDNQILHLMMAELNQNAKAIQIM